MDQETWEELNAAIQMEETLRADSLRNLINKGNVDKSVQFYESAHSDVQKRMVVEIFCSDRITDATIHISKAFLTSTEDNCDSKLDAMHHIRALAVCQLEGSFKNSDNYRNNLELRRKAEKEIL